MILSTAIPLPYTSEYHSESRDRNTRHSCDPKLPVTYSELMKKHLLHECPYQWMHSDDYLKQFYFQKHTRAQLAAKI